MKRIIFSVMGMLMLVLAFSGCAKHNAKKQSATDHQTILDYASSHNLKGQFTDSGIYYVIQDSGNAKHPTLSSNLNVNYKGYFMDDKIFDQGKDVNFPLSGVIKGWQEGLQLIGEGGKIKLLVPSGLAYGDNGYGSIPGNTVLGFDVTLNYFSK